MVYTIFETRKVNDSAALNYIDLAALNIRKASLIL